MKVEREIAGIAVPFAAGVAFMSWYGNFILPCQALASALTFLIIAALVITLLHPNHKSFTSLKIRIMAGLCMVLCGILCVITSDITSVGRTIPGSIMEHIRSLGLVTGATIDRIDFTDPDTNAIIKALIIGDRSDIPRHIRDAFSRSGASHILALSGLHLGMIYGILNVSLTALGNSPASKSLRSAIIVSTCGIYTLATGAGASIVRAFIFILLGETAKVTGRFRSTGTLLMASMLIHLTVTPEAIREVGFQLSYAAMAGIAFIFPMLQGFWPEENGSIRMKGPLKWIWTTAALSISCQITTGPLAYLHFGTFPMYFLLTNLIALPLTGIIIPAAVAVTLLTAVGWCPEILARATEALVTALSEALEIISLM